MYARLLSARSTSRWRRLLAPIAMMPARALPLPPVADLGVQNSGALRRTIWMYWHDGADAMPGLARSCAESWARANPGWEVRVLDRTSPEVRDTLDFMPGGCRMQLVADVLRLDLLNRFGGVWADMSCLCIRPLDEWLPEHMPHGFFAFASPGWDRPLANWFLAAQPSARLNTGWLAMARAYWSDDYRSNHIGAKKRVDQFIHHYLFDWMIHSSPEMGRMWRETRSFSAVPAHLLQMWIKDRERQPDLRDRTLAALADHRVPVQKLDWRTHDGKARLERALAEARDAGVEVES